MPDAELRPLRPAQNYDPMMFSYIQLRIGLDEWVGLQSQCFEPSDLFSKGIHYLLVHWSIASRVTRAAFPDKRVARLPECPAYYLWRRALLRAAERHCFSCGPQNFSFFDLFRAAISFEGSCNEERVEENFANLAIDTRIANTLL